MRKSLFLLYSALVLLCSSCSSYPNEHTFSPKENSKAELIIDQLSDLADINIKWLTEQNGWVRSVSKPSSEGMIRFTYQERWTHYIEHPKECLEEMWIIRRTESEDDGQLLMHTADGYVGDVIKLRKTIYFNNSSEELNKKPAYCLIADRSMPLNDLNAVLQNMEYIIETNVMEDKYNGIDVLILEIHYRGDNTDLLGTPENAIGKKETIYYDKMTGNRIHFDLDLEYPNEVWGGKTFVDYEIFFYETLPADIQKKFDRSIKELLYYLDL